MPSIFSRWSFKLVPWTALCLTLWGTLLSAADIGRGLDPVILKGQDLSGLLGKDIIGIRLYAYNAEEISWYAVPFQVDEVATVKDSGYYAFKNYALDPKDELVFMARDLGDQAPERTWLDDATVVQNPRYEIAVQNPLTGALGYLYAYWSPYIPASDRSYIAYANETISAESYEAGQDKAKAGGMLTSLVIPTAAGGDGVNLMDEQRLRITTTAGHSLVKDLTLQIREQWRKTYDLNAKIGGKIGEINVDAKHRQYKSTEGPIRIIRTNYLEVHLWGYARISGIGGGDFDQTIVLPFGYKFYPNFYEMPYDSISIDLSKSLTGLEEYGLSLKSSKILMCTTLNSNGFGMRFLTPRLATDAARQAGLKIDGKTDTGVYGPVSDLIAGEWPGKQWYGLAADAVAPASPVTRATLFTVATLRGARPMENQYIRYNDADAEDGTPAVNGLNGIQLEQSAGLPAAIPLNLTLRQYVFPQVYGYNQLQAMFDQYKTPLKVSAAKQVFDIIPPGTITDLQISGRADSSITLTWTAVGDDCTRVRAATTYLIRYSAAKPAGNRDWDWWGSATTIYPAPTPAAPGTAQFFTLSGLAPDHQYYIGIRAIDEADNASPSIAMVTSVTTPVELTAFAAIARDGRIELVWRTASESNNFGFALERRLEKEIAWRQIAFIKGHGTTSTAQSYGWSDGEAAPGKIEYRLKQVDNDGRATYSDAISVTFKSPSTWLLAQNFPNPFNPTTTIVYQVPANARGTVALTIYDLLGRRIRRLAQEEAQAGYYRIEWDGRDDQGLATGSGVYMYMLTASETQIVRKMIKLQ